MPISYLAFWVSCLLLYIYYNKINAFKFEITPMYYWHVQPADHSPSMLMLCTQYANILLAILCLLFTSISSLLWNFFHIRSHSYAQPAYCSTGMLRLCTQYAHILLPILHLFCTSFQHHVLRVWSYTNPVSSISCIWHIMYLACPFVYPVSR